MKPRTSFAIVDQKPAPRPGPWVRGLGRPLAAYEAELVVGGGGLFPRPAVLKAQDWWEVRRGEFAYHPEWRPMLEYLRRKAEKELATQFADAKFIEPKKEVIL